MYVMYSAEKQVVMMIIILNNRLYIVTRLLDRYTTKIMVSMIFCPDYNVSVTSVLSYVVVLLSLMPAANQAMPCSFAPEAIRRGLISIVGR